MEPDDYTERVPYGSAYGVENLAAQQALRTAAIVALDHALLGLAEFAQGYEMARLAEEHADPDARRVFAKYASRVPVDPVMVVERLPEVYRERYATFDFLKNWSVTMAVVGWKLAQAEPASLTNTAEEFAMHCLIEDAVGSLQDRDPENGEGVEQLENLYESAFEDQDFLMLYSVTSSDYAKENALSGRDYFRFDNWFFPFGSGVDRGVSHPFLLDGQTAPGN